MGLAGVCQCAVSRFLSFSPFCQHPIHQAISDSGKWESGVLGNLLWAMEQPLPSRQHRLTLSEDEKSPVPPLFMDIGANVGWFTINMAARGYDVAAFEGVDE